MKTIIKTPARLHLGIIDPNGVTGNAFRSVGVAIDKPNVVIEAEPSDKIEVFGRDSEIVSSALDKVCSHFGISKGFRIEVKESIPRHCGLGSGTQMMLAASVAYAMMHGIKTSPRELAQILGRGAVSGIGVAAYEKGGFIIDSGIDPKKQDIPVPVFQEPFPGDWAFVVAVPKTEKGLSGKNEDEAFRKIIPYPKEDAVAASSLVNSEMVMALRKKDIRSFGMLLTALDRRTGGYFYKAQKGLHKDTETASIIQEMHSLGAYGAGQSSWGPACYALTKEDDTADLEKELRKKFIGDLFTARPNNKGAEIK